MKSNCSLDISPEIAALAHFFSIDDNVLFALLFGSAKDGRLRSGSDLDLAVYFSTPPRSGIEEFEYYAAICELLQARVEKVDLVILNRANVILAFEALSGRFLVKKDPEAAAGFQSLISRQYEDIMASIDYQYTLRSV